MLASPPSTSKAQATQSTIAQLWIRLSTASQPVEPQPLLALSMDLHSSPAGRHDSTLCSSARSILDLQSLRGRGVAEIGGMVVRNLIIKIQQNPQNISQNSGVHKRAVFQGCSPGTKTGTRVHSDVPLERKPERGYVRMFPNRNEGTFTKTTLSRNHPFVSSEIEPLRNYSPLTPSFRYPHLPFTIEKA